MFALLKGAIIVLAKKTPAMNDIDVPKHEIFTTLIEKSSHICFAYHIRLKQFIYLNKAFRLFFQLTGESIKYDENIFFRCIHEDYVEYAKDTYQKLMEQELVQGVILRMKLHDDSLRTMELEASLFHIAGEAYIAGIANDITEEFNQLFVVNKFAEKKNAILEILSHDLTAPLGNIQMCAALIKSDGHSLEKAVVNELLDKIIVNSERSLKLIRAFLEKEFLETFKAALVKLRINLVEKIANFVEEFKKAGSRVNRSIIVSANTNLVYVHADEPKFIQVLQNLLSNAIKFTHEGGIINITITDRETNVLVTIEDNGIGIPAQLQKDLFERFSKAGRMGLQGEKSVGLGMSIIKKIIEWHGGKIWFVSEENKGTTFFIEIPKEQGED